MRDDLGDRMKKYEYITRTHLIPRMPVIIRIDGKAFHTFTRGFKRPYDEVLVWCMQETMKKLCENIQGCVLGYTQSDEITLVLVDYKRLETSSWFDYNIQKCVSIAASMATLYFNQAFRYKKFDYAINLTMDQLREENEYIKTLENAADKGAMFDARVFNVPKEEVTNCLLWRQNDAVRNSIQMLGQAHFSHKELQNKTSKDIQNMLFSEKGVNWNDYRTTLRRGSCCIRTQEDGYIRPHWVIDEYIPIFKDEGRKYIDDLIYVGEQSNEFLEETRG